MSYQDPMAKHDLPYPLLDREWWADDEPLARCIKTLTRWQRFTMAIRKIVGRAL